MSESQLPDHSDLPEVPEATGGGTATVTITVHPSAGVRW